MENVIFTFKEINTLIQCNREDKMKDICNKFANKIGIDINLIYFLYNGIQLNLELNQQINNINKDKNEMNIFVYEKLKNNIIIDEGIIKSNEIICPKCKENCKIKINDYKIKLYDCKNKHEINNILLDEYDITQNINELNIICNICKKNNKYKSYNNKFYICLLCKKNICLLCKSKHDNNHKIIDYDRKNYICNNHNENYISYCKECKMNLCLQCEIKHNDNHEIINYRNILPNENKIKEEIKEFRNKIEKFNNKINKIIEMFEKVKKAIEYIYIINNDIINNYKIEDRNYEILYNINEIRNNIKIKEIDEIINNNHINKAIKNIIKIYNKIIINNNINLINNENKIIKDQENNNNKDNNDIITIIYKIEKKVIEVRLFGQNFIKNNKDKCKYIYEDKEYELEENFKLSNYDKDKLEIKLKGINNITDMSYMFSWCLSLSSLPDISKWNTSNVTNMSFMFYNCSILSSLPDISKWNTNNVIDMSYMFNNCRSLLSLPDISKWKTNNVRNMNFMFSNCSSLSSLPDISKWNINNVKNMSFMFYNCSSLSSFPDISNWNINNAKIKICLFSYCSSLSSLPDISKWNFNNHTNMDKMFDNCQNSLNLP